MSSSSESDDFENNSFETDESDEFPSENELSDIYGKVFLISCPINLSQRRKKILKTLDNVGSSK